MRILRFFVFIAFAGWILPACNPVKDLKENEYLLNKNIVKSENNDLNSGAKAILKQKPNRKILGVFRFHLGVYNLANSGKQTKFKKWVKRTIGEEPVILEPVLTDRSTTQVRQYLQNEGYFNGVVTDSTVYKKNRQANVIYTLLPGKPYIIRSLKYEISDPLVRTIVLADTVNAVLKSGKRYQTSVFSEERERVTRLLRNIGFYDFNQAYISFDIDSSLKSHQADVIFKIGGTKSSSDTSDTSAAGLHRVYRIKNVFIQTEYDPLATTTITDFDTVSYKKFQFLSRTPKLRYKPKSLTPRIYIESGDLYKIKNADNTYRGIADLGLFKFVNIRYEKVKNDSLPGYWLNSNILLSPSPKQDYKFELEGTNNGGNFGVGGIFTYRNKNSFRGAESIEFKFTAKAESIPEITDDVNAKNDPFSLNTVEIGPEITLRIPRFLWPLSNANKNRAANPVTLFSTSFNFQKRIEYIRNLMLFSTGFEYKKNRFNHHYFYPAEINFSSYDITPAFNEILQESNDPRLINYFRNYLITNGRYTYVYNSQVPQSFTDFVYLRFTMKIAGNSLRLVNLITKTDYSDTSRYELFGVQYSQYVRPEIDIRYYQVFNKNSSLVYRLAGGMGIAYLNSDDLPYEETFFTGGVNDLRAYLPRSIGPGSYKPDILVEQLGDIKINANVEYRSDIFKVLEGAIFLDAGNIWLLRKNENQPNGEFEISRFYKEFALGTGLGLRFDFNFFIFRLDFGVPLRNPGRDPGDRWVVPYLKVNQINLNFGIGYPF